MLRYFKSIIYLTLMLCIYSCGTNISDTKIPVSTKSAEADNLLQEALQLNSISKGDEAKKKLLKAIEIDEKNINDESVALDVYRKVMNEITS